MMSGIEYSLRMLFGAAMVGLCQWMFGLMPGILIGLVSAVVLSLVHFALFPSRPGKRK